MFSPSQHRACELREGYVWVRLDLNSVPAIGVYKDGGPAGSNRRMVCDHEIREVSGNRWVFGTLLSGGGSWACANRKVVWISHYQMFLRSYAASVTSWIFPHRCQDYLFPSSQSVQFQYFYSVPGIKTTLALFHLKQIILKLSFPKTGRTYRLWCLYLCFFPYPQPP